MDIEISISNLERVIENINQEVIRQGHIIDILVRQNQELANVLKANNINPLSGNEKPPHY